MGGWWFFRRRKKSKEGGLKSGWTSEERSFAELEDPDEKGPGRWMSGYGFGRSSTLGPTSWPEKNYFGKRRVGSSSHSFIISAGRYVLDADLFCCLVFDASQSNFLAPHLPTLPQHLDPPPQPVQSTPLDKNNNPFNDPLPPAKPVDAATAHAALPKRSNSIPRKTVPPRDPFAVPGLPRNPSPPVRYPVFYPPGAARGRGSAATASTSYASLNDSNNSSGSSVDDRHLSLTSTDRSSMSSNLQFHTSVTDSIDAIFQQMPSPATSPHPTARIPRPRIPSITLTMATGSIYSSASTAPSPGGGNHGSEQEKMENPFASRVDSFALREEEEEEETDSIRSSKSSSELPPLFTTAASLAEDEERESSLRSSSTAAPPLFNNLFPAPLPPPSEHFTTSNPYHPHLPHQRLPPVQSSQLASNSNSNFSSPPLLSSSSHTNNSTQPFPISPAFPYPSPPTPPETPATAQVIRTVLQNDQRATSLYRDALERRKTLSDSMMSNDSLDHLGSLLGHGEEGKRNEKWPRPPGEM